MPSFEIGDMKIQYSTVKGTSRRYTYFRFMPDLTLMVMLPRGRQVDVEKALREKSSWIRQEYDRVTSTRLIMTDDTVMFGGELLRVVFRESTHDILVPSPGTQEVVVHTSDRRRLKELVRRWFLKESSSYVVRRVSQLAPSMRVRPSKVDVREINKWGYCTRKGRISFSWQLAALSDRLKDYVVFHELTHLLVFNHGPAFKRKLAAVCPDFRQRERELDKIALYGKLN